MPDRLSAPLPIAARCRSRYIESGRRDVPSQASEAVLDVSPPVHFEAMSALLTRMVDEHATADDNRSMAALAAVRLR